MEGVRIGGDKGHGAHYISANCSLYVYQRYFMVMKVT